MTDHLIPTTSAEGDYGTVNTPAPPVDTSSFLRKFGCEMSMGVFIIVAIVLAALLGAGYTLSRTSKAEVTFHQPCVECLNLGHVYNESNHTCTTLSSSNFTSFTTCPECVADPKYCGAPECRAKQPFPPEWKFDNVLTPYWFLLVCSVIVVLLSGGINALRIFVVRPFKKKYWVEYADDLDALEKEGGDFAFKRSLYIFINVFGAMNGYWYMVLYVFAMGHYVYIIYEVRQYHAGLTDWNKFLAIHLLWFNSGTVAVLGICLVQFMTHLSMQAGLENVLGKKYFLEQPDNSVLRRSLYSIVAPLITSVNDEGLAIAFHVVIFPLPLLAPTLLMVIPMLVVFLPMALAVLFLWFLIFAIALHISTRKTISLSSLALAVFMCRILCTFLIMSLFQTAVNYAVLFYSGMGWTDTIRNEFQLRDTKCYFNALLNSVQLANIGFAGLFLS